MSVVITTWNRREDLKDTLLKLKDQQYNNLEIIVVDNGSSDGTIKMINELFKEVRLVPLSENMGIEGTNIGMREAKGRYILLLDNDSFPKEDSISKMVTAFEKDPEVGIVAFNIRGPYYTDSHLSTSCQSVYGFSGGGAGIRKSILEEVGYFPREFFLYLCEQDLSIRVLNKGYKIVHYPDIIAYHRSSSISRNRRQIAYYYTRNLFWLFLRYYPINRLYRRMIELIYLVFYSSIEQQTSVYLKALIDALLESGKVIDSRIKVDEEVLKIVRIPMRLPFTFYR